MLKYDTDYNQLLYNAAIGYIKEGYYLVPIRPGEKLLPKKSSGVSYSKASKDRSIIDLWFHPEKGQFKGHNIGIATGMADGVFVIDVDQHGDIDGLKNLGKVMGDELWPEGPTQYTPTGGLHYIFQWRENATNTTAKICPGVDTRGGTEKECKGHIVVWPSMVEAGQYEWRGGFEEPKPQIPTRIMDKLGVLWRSKSTLSRGSENVDEGDSEEILPMEQITEMLESIDPNELSYDDWLQIGQAINSQYPGPDGFTMWDYWSQGGDRYEANECHIRWSGFAPGGSVRIGTLYHHAMESGWKPKKGQKKANEFDILVEKVNKEYAIVMVGGKIRILRLGLPVKDPMLDTHYQIMDKESFKTLMENEIYWPKGEDKPVKVANIWLAHESRRTYRAGLGLYPYERPPEGRFNTWNGLAASPAQGNCEQFLEHIEKVVCRNNKDQYEWLMDWCADSVQDPGNPKGCAIVMKGAEGSGKGTLANTMLSLFGVHGKHLIDDSHLVSNFNSHMMDAIFVFADEITWGGNIKTAGKLKGIVTEKYLLGERKGVDAVSYRNMCHLMVASNEQWVIPAGSKSRRWFVLNVDPRKATNEDYFNEIIHELENGGREAFLHFLLERKITNNLRTAMETEGLQEQREFSIYQDRCNEWWVEILESEVLPVGGAGQVDPSDHNKWPTEVKMTELYTAYKEWCIENRANRTYPMAQWKRKVIEEFGLLSDGRNLVMPKPEECRSILKSTIGIEL